MLGEDSGLEVAALGGAPGIRSARYGAEGGEAIERLLVQLPAGESPSPVIERLEALGGSLQSLEVGHEADRRTVLIDVTLPPKADPPAIVADLSELEHVLEIRWSD